MNKKQIKRRFFIAVFPPEHIAKQIESIKRYGPSSWEWKNAEDYHISLAFPGTLNETELEKLKKSLEKIAAESFDLTLDDIKIFESPIIQQNQNRRKMKNRHVLWGNPDDGTGNEQRKILGLHFSIAHTLRRHGFKYGIKDITPHLTLAKAPNDEIDLVKEFCRAAKGTKNLSWHCDRFGLYETLSPSDKRHPKNNNGRGSRYVKIAEFKLRR